jgi:hypothetical protein
MDNVSDLRALLGLAEQVAAGKQLRMPIEVQIRAFAATALELRALLGRYVAADAEAIAAVREIVR